MKLTQVQQTVVLVVLVVVLVFLIGYRFMTEEKQKTAPLIYQRGAVASSPVRQGLSTRKAGADPLNVFLERRGEKYPGVRRDIFRMENPVPKPKLLVSRITATPPVHVKTPEEIAADAAQAAAEAARADLLKFQFLGYLTEKDSTLFLSKDGELFIVKRGDTILKSYKVKEGTKNYVVLLDTVTGVEVRLEIPGGELATPKASGQSPLQPYQQVTPEQQRIQRRRQRFNPGQTQTPVPAAGTQPVPGQ
jgi:hypothetical protein